MFKHVGLVIFDRIDIADPVLGVDQNVEKILCPGPT